MNIKRTGILLKPDNSRVLLRPFEPHTEARILRIIKRVLSVTEKEVQMLLDDVHSGFDGRHHRLRTFLLERYLWVQNHLPEKKSNLSENRMLLIGAYFTQEYAFESAALFNPSIVWHPDQTKLRAGTRRFILSLRATGEGHVSSISFRSGTITANDVIRIEKPSRFVVAGQVALDVSYDRHLFTRKLKEIGITSSVVDEVFQGLGEKFTMLELEDRLENVSQNYDATVASSRIFERNRDHIMMLGQSNYQVSFTADQTLSERILFPTAQSERNGIEDARFVHFTDQGTSKYYATYTAYNGIITVPQLIETSDFLQFNMSTLNGPEVHNKGMALFPRTIGGQYAMLSRQDGENIYLMLSEHPHFWSNKQLIVAPKQPWEFVQVGNCGSPIETERGWLVLSHGVGPMRQYAISAFLLDLDDPRKVIGRLHEPLLTAHGEEREGYVPNVVYSCGAILNGDSLILPYAVSDYSTSIAIANLTEVLDSMKN